MSPSPVFSVNLYEFVGYPAWFLHTKSDIEHGHWNSGISQEKWWFSRFVKLPEGISPCIPLSHHHSWILVKNGIAIPGTEIVVSGMCPPLPECLQQVDVTRHLRRSCKRSAQVRHISWQPNEDIKMWGFGAKKRCDFKAMWPCFKGYVGYVPQCICTICAKKTSKQRGLWCFDPPLPIRKLSFKTSAEAWLLQSRPKETLDIHRFKIR